MFVSIRENVRDCLKDSGDSMDNSLRYISDGVETGMRNEWREMVIRRSQVRMLQYESLVRSMLGAGAGSRA